MGRGGSVSTYSGSGSQASSLQGLVRISEPLSQGLPPSLGGIHLR